MMRSTLLLIAATMFCYMALPVDVRPESLPPGAKKLATYAPRPRVPAEARAKHLKGAGIFVVYVRPDGAVSRVETVRSTGYAILDKASIDAFSQWRFIPGSIKKVKIPVQYTGVYPQE